MLIELQGQAQNAHKRQCFRHFSSHWPLSDTKFNSLTNEPENGLKRPFSFPLDF